MAGLSFFKTLAPFVYLGRFVVGPAISKAGQPAFRSRFFNRSNKLTTDCRMLRPCNKPKKGNHIQARSKVKPQTPNLKPQTTNPKQQIIAEPLFSLKRIEIRIIKKISEGTGNLL